MLEQIQTPLAEPSVVTSLVEVTELFKDNIPCRVFFKNEYEQPSGSFKLRGIGHLIKRRMEELERRGVRVSREVRVFASSGGNAGLAAAYTLAYYGLSCTVVVPVLCRQHIVEKLESYGVSVVKHGASIDDACVHARELMACCTQIPIFCHPFDDPLVWEGHLEIVAEIFLQLSPTDARSVRALCCSVGGGGLYHGILSGLLARGSRAQCLLAETKEAPTLYTSVQAGHVVPLTLPQTVATSLACSYVPGATLERFQERNDVLCMVDDLCAVRATLRYERDFGVPVEPACGAALALVYDHVNLKAADLQENDILVVVVCGGLCADPAAFAEYRKMLRQNKV